MDWTNSLPACALPKLDRAWVKWQALAPEQQLTLWAGLLPGEMFWLMEGKPAVIIHSTTLPPSFHCRGWLPGSAVVVGLLPVEAAPVRCVCM